MFQSYDPVNSREIRRSVRDLRHSFGVQPWTTVASGVLAEAYRLAGMTGEEFDELLRAQTAERDSLLIHLRRKPIMRLRKGFDCQSGAIHDEEGVIILNLHFEGGSYTELDSDKGSPALRVFGRQPSYLRVTGAMDRPLSEIARALPRCMHPKSIRARSLSFDVDQRNETMRVDVRQHWETLALMPDWASRALGVPPQVTLDQMPWLPFATPVREDAATPAAARPANVPRARAQLSLVAGT